MGNWFPRPSLDRSTVAVSAPGDGPGFWAGGPSATVVDGTTFLAYRLRRPIGSGRGYANVVAASADGVRFEVLVTLNSVDFGADSLERPALVALPGGGFRIYVSCATPGTKHWRVDAIDAPDASSFDPANRRTVLPGGDDWAVKDPVIKIHDGSWHMWATLHPLADWDGADRMHSAYATSDDGLAWRWHGTALEGRAGAWDSRGTRVAEVLLGRDQVIAYYDGRATAEENYEERTGVATGTLTQLRAYDDAPLAASPHAGRGLRYLTVLAQPDGSTRLYYEATRPDGAHDLLTELVPPSVR